jgi:hypothetical protein
MYIWYYDNLILDSATISPELFQAMMIAESNGNINATSVIDGDKAIGPFLIRETYWIAAVENLPYLMATVWIYQDCQGPGSIEFSMNVVQVRTLMNAQVTLTQEPACWRHEVLHLYILCVSYSSLRS